MGDYIFIDEDDYLEHHGIMGMKWGVRRYQNADGSLTKAGRERYGRGPIGDLNYLNQKNSDISKAAMRSYRSFKFGRYGGGISAALGLALATTIHPAIGVSTAVLGTLITGIPETVSTNKHTNTMKVGSSSGDYLIKKYATKKDKKLPIINKDLPIEKVQESYADMYDLKYVYPTDEYQNKAGTFHQPGAIIRGMDSKTFKEYIYDKDSSIDKALKDCITKYY